MSLTQLLAELSTNMRMDNPLMEMWLDVRAAHLERTGEALYGGSISIVRRMHHAPE